MADPGKSNWDILNVGYGVLNPLGDTLTGKAYNPNDTGFFSMVRQAAVENYSPTVGANTGPMLGIVLRNEGKMSLHGPVDPTNWAHRYSQLVENRSDLALIQLRVRVPEIHAHLPVPVNLPPKEESSPDHKITNMYPIFIGQFDEIDAGREPMHGSLVWVDFQNRSTFQGPIYLGAVESAKTYLPSVEYEMSNKFAGICNKILNEAVSAAGATTPVGKTGGNASKQSAQQPPILNSSGKPNTLTKKLLAVGQQLFPTLGAAAAASQTKAAQSVVAAAKKGVNQAMLVYCKRLQRLQGEVANLQNKFPNVPFPAGTNVCDKATIDQLINDHFTPGGSKYNGGMLDSFIGRSNGGDPWKTGITKEQRAANAKKVYEMFTKNGYTPQAALAVLSHTVGETAYDNNVPGGGKGKSSDKDSPDYWAFQGTYQASTKYAPAISKGLNPANCFDMSTNENYYDKIGGGKKPAHAPEKYAYTKRPSNPRNLAKDHKSGRGSISEKAWEAGNGTYWDAGDIGASTMFQIARLRGERGKTVGKGRLGALDALMRNPDATGAQVYALMRNTTFAKGVGFTEQKSTKRRMDNAAKRMGECYTGQGYVQNFKPGTT